MSNRVITINRMFGSNGRIIGKALAEELGFKFYDNELIEMASREKNIPFDEFARVDERKASQWLYPVDYELQMNPEYHFVPMNDVLYDLQKKIILEAAEKENCVPYPYVSPASLHSFPPGRYVQSPSSHGPQTEHR